MIRNKVIAFDIGGTSIRAALVKNNKIIEYFKIPTPKKKKLFLEKIDELVKKFNSISVKGIGVGIPSPVKDGVVKNAPNIALKNFDLKKYLQKKYKKKVEIKNDAGCFALAEAKLGTKSDNFILVTLGTGIGGGIVINGEEYRGTGYGAEFGHMYLRDKEWESLWKNTRKKIKREFKEQILIKDLVRMKSKKAENILDEAADYLGQGIASLISAFDPEVVLIGGGLRESGHSFLKQIRRKVKKYSFLPKTTPIHWTKL
ncbi:MAG: ROK family protein, partial [Candidatus Pacearchaeota archaeon]|nr:ROK family protein [Candidatus Pacearchaeota archaeon]